LRADADSYFIERTDTTKNIMLLMEAGRFEDAVEQGKTWRIRSAYRAQLIKMAAVGKQLQEKEE